jgi:prolyl oligopeptidase
VEPWQAAKLAARMQAASARGNPVLLRVDYESGHGPGTPRALRAAEVADIYAFALWQFGDPEFVPPRREPPPEEHEADVAPAPLSAR